MNDLTKHFAEQWARDEAHPIDRTSILTELEGMLASPARSLNRPQSAREAVRVARQALVRLLDYHAEGEARDDAKMACDLATGLRTLAQLIDPKVVRVKVGTEVPEAEMKALLEHLNESIIDPDYAIVTNYPVDFQVCSGSVWSEAQIRAAYFSRSSDTEAVTYEDDLIEALKSRTWTDAEITETFVRCPECSPLLSPTYLKPQEGL